MCGGHCSCYFDHVNKALLVIAPCWSSVTWPAYGLGREWVYSRNPILSPCCPPLAIKRIEIHDLMAQHATRLLALPTETFDVHVTTQPSTQHVVHRITFCKHGFSFFKSDGISIIPRNDLW